MTKTELKAKYNETLLKANETLNNLIVSTFFAPLKPCKIKESEHKIYLLDETANGLTKTSCNRHREGFNKALEAVFGAPYTFEVVDKEPGEEEKDDPIDLYLKEDALIPEYTFETYVNGPNSNLAFAACLSVADSFSKKYNPLFIYGGSVLRKTHLMHAIGHYVLRNRPKKKVLYVSAETFVSELVEAIRLRTTQAFKNKYRKVDYLLFDDVQFIAGKSAAVEEELFNTFEALDNSNKQIVFTSDRPPTELGDLPERLVARFSQGIPVDIKAPE
ncbi:MAG: DnaA/Hda family protein, partial [Clostridia bacterium]|nr:DnaA/Hda family protein [Clostridia bacterium]